MTIYELTELVDALCELFEARGRTIRLVSAEAGYEELALDGVRIQVERTDKGFALCAFTTEGEPYDLTRGTPEKILERADAAFATFWAKRVIGPLAPGRKAA